MDELLTVKEVADYLRLSRHTVWRWCHAGKLRAVKVGHSWRVKRAEVEQLVERDEADPQHQESSNA